MEADPYLEIREKEDAFLLRVLETIRAGLSQGTSSNGADTLLRLLQVAQSQSTQVEKTPQEDQQEADDMALDFVNGFGYQKLRYGYHTRINQFQKLRHQEDKYAAELDSALAQYTELQQQAADMDTIELEATHQAIRPSKERETAQRLQAT